MSDAHARVSKIIDQIHDLTRELAEINDDLDGGDILTDIMVIVGTVDPSTHLASVLYYSRPETPAYTLRGLVQVTSDEMAAAVVANVVVLDGGSGWDGDTTGWDGGDDDD